MTGIPEWFVQLDLHPAVLAGPHAWHLHGLTAIAPTDQPLHLLLPAGQPERAGEVLEDIRGQLSRHWHPDDVALPRTRNAVEVDRRGSRTVITAEPMLPERPPMPPTVALLHGGYLPIVDRRTALVEWTTSLDGRTTGQDTIDVGRWARPLADLGRSPERAVLTGELAHIGRSPAATRGIQDVVAAARRHWCDTDVHDLVPGLEQLAVTIRVGNPSRALRRR